jgi:hypothetical protein
MPAPRLSTVLLTVSLILSPPHANVSPQRWQRMVRAVSPCCQWRSPRLNCTADPPWLPSGFIGCSSRAPSLSRTRSFQSVRQRWPLRRITEADCDSRTCLQGSTIASSPGSTLSRPSSTLRTSTVRPLGIRLRPLVDADVDPPLLHPPHGQTSCPSCVLPCAPPAPGGL